MLALLERLELELELEPRLLDGLILLELVDLAEVVFIELLGLTVLENLELDRIGLMLEGIFAELNEILELDEIFFELDDTLAELVETFLTLDELLAELTETFLELDEGLAEVDDIFLELEEALAELVVAFLELVEAGFLELEVLVVFMLLDELFLVLELTARPTKAAEVGSASGMMGMTPLISPLDWSASRLSSTALRF